MILVTGATGNLGTAIIESLLKNTTADKIIAFARDENKAKKLIAQGVEVRIGTYDDPASLSIAMKGIEKLLLVSGNDPHQSLQQHKNVIDVARNAGVKHLIYTGILIRDINSSAIKSFLEGLTQTEDYLRESGITYTILRNTLYTDGIQRFAGEHVFTSGINLPAGNGKVAYALRREMGEAAANVLLQDGHENKTYEITGNSLYSYRDVAAALSALSGTVITYTDANNETFKAQLTKLGLPEMVITVLAGFSADIKSGQYEIQTNDLEKLLGRKPAPLNESLKEIYKL